MDLVVGGSARLCKLLGEFTELYLIYISQNKKVFVE